MLVFGNSFFIERVFVNSRPIMIGFFFNFLGQTGLEPVGNHVHMTIIRCYYDILKKVNLSP